MQDNKQACQLAESALQDAMNKIDEVDEETFRDAKSIIELLKENLTLWKEEAEGGAKDVDDLWLWGIGHNYFLFNFCSIILFLFGWDNNICYDVLRNLLLFK